jgi:hypothetical protein
MFAGFPFAGGYFAGAPLEGAVILIPVTADYIIMVRPDVGIILIRPEPGNVEAD